MSLFFSLPAQVLWRAPDEASSCPSPGVTRPSRPAVVPTPASALTLATWRSCWSDTGAATEKERAPSPLFCRVKEGEKVGVVVMVVMVVMVT